MKIETQYSKVERVVYEFNETDMRNALLEYAQKISAGKLAYRNRRIELDVRAGDESNDYKPSATLTVKMECPAGEPAPPSADSPIDKC